MLRRHHRSNSGALGASSVPRLQTRMALWTQMQRDPVLLQNFPQVVEHLARHLSVQQGGARIRSEQARDYHLPNLAAADRWWKRQWRVVSPHSPTTGPSRGPAENE